MNVQPTETETHPRGAPAGTGPLRLERETPGQAVELADGFWVIATRHRPGLSKHMFEINNRCFVFRLDEPGVGRVLLVANAVAPSQAIEEVRRLERETGHPVRYIVSPGGGHHLLMQPWHAAFGDAQVLLPPGRIPRTANGRELVKLPRVSLMDPADPLPAFRGQLDAVVFQGLLGPIDLQTPAEGGADTRWKMITGMMKMMPPRDPIDELWLHHVPTRTVIAGENLAWYYPGPAYRQQPFMLRQMVKPDKVWIWTMARKVGDAAAVSASWRRILAWPCRTLMTYHDVPGSAFVGDGQAALAEAVRAVGQLAPA